jgi:hypothetical protein
MYIMNGREPFPTNKTGCAHRISNWCRYPDPHNLQIAWPAHFNPFPSLQHESSTTDARTATSYGFGCDPVARQIELWHQGECPLSSHTQLQAVTPAVVNWCSWFWIPVALVDGFKGFAQIGITLPKKTFLLSWKICAGLKKIRSSILGFQPF